MLAMPSGRSHSMRLSLCLRPRLCLCLCCRCLRLCLCLASTTASTADERVAVSGRQALAGLAASGRDRHAHRGALRARAHTHTHSQSDTHTQSHTHARARDAPLIATLGTSLAQIGQLRRVARSRSSSSNSGASIRRSASRALSFARALLACSSTQPDSGAGRSRRCHGLDLPTALRARSSAECPPPPPGSTMAVAESRVHRLHSALAIREP